MSKTFSNKAIEKGYDEIQFRVASGKVPSSNFPNWELMTATCSEYAFAVNEYIDLNSEELPHWWLEGSAADAHVHFSTKQANTSGTTTYAKFTGTFAYADINEGWVEVAKTAEYAITSPTGATTHLYLDMGDLDLTNYKLGAKIKCHIKRIAATSGTEYPADVYIHDIGLHMIRYRLGSINETS